MGLCCQQGQAGDVEGQELLEVQQGEVQSPLPGEEQPHAPMYTGSCLAGKICWYIKPDFVIFLF